MKISFFIVLAAALVLVFFYGYPEAPSRLLWAAGVGLGFGLATYWFRFLSLSGALAGGMLAFSLLAMPGWGWAVPGFVFFFLSSLLSKVGKGRKAVAAARAEKGDQRDAGQVVANGGVAWVLLLAYVLYPAPVFYIGFVGAFAAATADTWGTEIGTLWHGTPRLITTGRPVPPGTSGAVSAVGLAGTALGAAVLGLSSWPFVQEIGAAQEAGVFFGIVFATGSLAALLDSLLGATVQARFQDPLTGGETEHPASKAGPHTLIRGWSWLKNDQVNGVCTAAGALLAMTCFQVLVFAS